MVVTDTPGWKILGTDVYMLGIDLAEPFPLGFGTLSQLPRVLFKVTAACGAQTVEGIGEASIDFPFSHYDAYDIYHSLTSVDIKGEKLESREALLLSKSLRKTLLSETPAAFAAFNMALDDAYGKAYDVNVTTLYGSKRSSAKCLSSISFQKDVTSLIDKARKNVSNGFIPKVKAGKSLEDDISVLAAVDQDAIKANYKYAIDFNAQYSSAEIDKVFLELHRLGATMERALFIEQPTNESEGVAGLSRSKKKFFEVFHHDKVFIADESFVTLDDAIECAQSGIDLNFKIHKVGGLFVAREIEGKLNSLSLLPMQSMVGGTFPTSIGRVYDQQCAMVLESVNMPSDGMEPSTEWFDGGKHLINEDFNQPDRNGDFKPKTGTGIGATPNWDNISRYIVADPKAEYRLIRDGKDGSKVKIQLKSGQSYGRLYRELTGKAPDWNLK